MKKCILYVEDAPQNMLLVGRILEALGHELLEAVDGKSGWELASNQTPDLILMDLHMPGEVNGFELTRRLKAHPDLKEIPVVALTSYGEEAVQQAMEAGCDGFLHKPADIQQIRSTIDKYLGPSNISPEPDLEDQSRESKSRPYTFI